MVLEPPLSLLMIQIHFSRVLKQVVELTIENQQLNAKGWWCHHRHVKSADVICNDDVILNAKKLCESNTKKIVWSSSPPQTCWSYHRPWKGFLPRSAPWFRQSPPQIPLSTWSWCPCKGVHWGKAHTQIYHLSSIIIICRTSKESTLIITLSGFMEEIPWLAHKVVNLANLTKGILGQEG